MSVDQGRDEQDSETNDSQPLNKTERVGSEMKHLWLKQGCRKRFRQRHRHPTPSSSSDPCHKQQEPLRTFRCFAFMSQRSRETEAGCSLQLFFDMREETVDIRRSNLCNNTHCLDWRIMMCIICRSVCNECFINKNPSSCRLLHDTYIGSGAEIKTTERMKEQTHVKSISIFFSQAINDRKQQSFLFSLIPLLSFP